MLQDIVQHTCLDCHAVHYYPEPDFIPFRCEDCNSSNIQILQFKKDVKENVQD